MIIVTFLFMKHFLPFSLKLDFLFCDHSHKRNIISLQYLMVIGNGIDSSITSSDSFSFVRYTNLIRFKPINLIAVGNWMFITYHKNHIFTLLIRFQRTRSNHIFKCRSSINIQALWEMILIFSIHKFVESTALFALYISLQQQIMHQSQVVLPIIR